MATDLVVTELRGAVAWIRMNRPDSMNAFNHSLLEAVDAQMTKVRDDVSVRVVVITGSQGVFSAGGDLKELLGPDGEVDSQDLLQLVKEAGETFDRIAAMDKPVIGAINGLAVAGGLELALACDLIIATTSARLGDGHSNYGLLPGGGGAARLARAVGPRVAKYLAFTGWTMPAADLVPLGLVNEVVPDDQLETRVHDLAECLARKSAAGLAHMKRLVNDGLDQPLAIALRAEHQALAVHARSRDMQEGLAAFREHRQPAYEGST